MEGKREPEFTFFHLHTEFKTTWEHFFLQDTTVWSEHLLYNKGQKDHIKKKIGLIPTTSRVSGRWPRNSLSTPECTQGERTRCLRDRDTVHMGTPAAQWPAEGGGGVFLRVRNGLPALESRKRALQLEIQLDPKWKNPSFRPKTSTIWQRNFWKQSDIRKGSHCYCLFSFCIS